MTAMTEKHRARRGHAFYPPKSTRIPMLGATEGKGDAALVRAHYFVGGWDWYVLELDRETGDAFGLVKGFETEYGYFNLPELEGVLAGGMFPVERDCYWDAVPVGTLR